MILRWFRSATVTAAMMLVLASCSGDGSSPSTAASSEAAEPSGSTSSAAASEAPAPPEIAELTVGVLPITDVAPVFIAIEEGLFEAEGLTVTTETMQGGAAAIPALVAGDLDIAFGAWPSFLLANQEGIPLRAVADGVAAQPGFTQFLALPDSGLEGDPAGMAGKIVAVNTLNNLGELAVRLNLQMAGADPQDVQLIEIPFPDMTAALERGDVDVIWAVEPTVSIAKSELGAVVVTDSYTGDLENFPVAGYQVTGDFADANPNTVAAFQRAIEAAAQMATDDPDLVIGLAPTFTSLTEDLASQISLPEFRGALEVAQLQRVYDNLVEFGIASEGLDLESLVISSE